jgi:hypothetical protein
MINMCYAMRLAIAKASSICPDHENTLFLSWKSANLSVELQR